MRGLIDENKTSSIIAFAENEEEEGATVVPILEWHLPEGESLFSDDPREGAVSTRSLGARSELQYILVMKRGKQSCRQAMRSQRFAGIDIAYVQQMAGKLAKCLKRLHDKRIIHGDVKPRNILLDGIQNQIMLCDLDASARTGSVRQLVDKNPSSGYSAPEIQRWQIWSSTPKNQRRLESLEIRASPLWDIWSFGVVLFQLCTGEELFAQDTCDDEIIDPRDEMRK